jgi:membrane-bound ClpP family serine protease
VGAALLAAVLAFALAPTWLGLLLLAIAVGMGFDFPDPEESWSAQLAERRRREAAQRRTAVAAAPLRPCGSVRTPDGQLRPARSLRGFIAAGEPVEIVNEVDGTCIVLRLRPAPSDPTESSPA